MAKGIEGADPEADHISAFTVFLKGRGLEFEPAESISGDVIHDYLKQRHFDKGHAGATAKRSWDPVRAAFNEAVRLKQANATPDFDIRDYTDLRPSNTPVIGKWLYPEEIALHIQCAPRHARPLFATLWNTGRRSGELVWVSRRAPDYNDANSTGLSLEPGREHLYLGRTKNGKPIFVWLNDAAVTVITDWLDQRDDEFDELFLTDKLVPYKKPRKKRGGIFRRAFNVARDNAADIIEDDWKLPARAEVMRKITPHWCRHNMTSHRLAAKEDESAVRKDMGWSSDAMVQRYGWDLPGKGKQRANIVQFGTKLAHGENDTQNKDDKSRA